MRHRNRKRRICEAVDLPESVLGPCPYLTVEGNGELLLNECLEILSYDEEEIRIRQRGLTVTVRGEGMTLFSYAAKNVRIRGKISGISFEEADRRE